MKKTTVILAIIMLNCIVSLALGEESHNHDWHYEHDKTTHWQVCTICNERTEAQEHIETCNIDKAGECAYCGASIDEDIVLSSSFVAHSFHTNEWYFNIDKHANRCLNCGEYLNEEEHFGSCIDPSTCYRCGVKSIDGYNIHESYHIYDKNDGYEFDSLAHWRRCVLCGEVIDYYSHDFYGESDSDFHFDANEHWRECKTCGQKIGSPHWAICVDKNTCMECGKNTSDGIIINEINHWGWASSPIEFNDEYHWYTCTDCGEKVFVEEHQFDNNNNCTECGYKKEETPLAESKYAISSVKYNGKELIGKVKHVNGTEICETIKIRVTFYVVGNYYMATVCTVDENGEFSLEGVGEITYITVMAFDGGTNGTGKSFDAAELFVK